MQASNWCWQPSGLQWKILGLLVGLVAGLSGCESVTRVDPRMKRLEGVWILDLAVNQELVDQLLDGDPNRPQTFQEKMLRGAAKQFFDEKMPELSEKLASAANRSMQLEFSAEGTWSSRTALPVARGQKSGTWSIQDSGQDFLLIQCVWQESKSSQSETVETRVSFVDPQRIRLVPPNMAGTELELTFVKQPAN